MNKLVKEQEFLTETIDKVYYVLTKQGNQITIKQDYSPYSPQWSNGTLKEYTIRLTRTKGVIDMYFFSDVSGQQRTRSNKIYVNRSELEEILNKGLSYEENQEDEALNFGALQNIFDSVNRLYDLNTPYF